MFCCNGWPRRGTPRRCALSAVTMTTTGERARAAHCRTPNRDCSFEVFPAALRAVTTVTCDGLLWLNFHRPLRADGEGEVRADGQSGREQHKIPCHSRLVALEVEPG